MNVLVGTTLLLLMCAVPAFAQSSMPTQRDVKQLVFNRARTDEMLGDLRGAAAQYRRIMNEKDPRSEFADIRANAGIALCHVETKLRHLQLAKEACQKTIQMPDAPQELKQKAREMLDVLERAQ